MSSRLEKVIEEHNKKEVLTPEELTADLINIFREECMEKNDVRNSQVMIVGEKGRFTVCPIPLSILKTTSLGKMMMNVLLKEIKQDDNIHSVLEMHFGTGMVLDGKDIEEEQIEKYKSEFSSLQEGNRDFLDHPEAQEYMIVNVCKPKGVNMSFYDVIRSTEKDATVISNKPLLEKDFEYSKDLPFTDYFN